MASATEVVIDSSATVVSSLIVVPSSTVRVAEVDTSARVGVGASLITTVAVSSEPVMVVNGTDDACFQLTAFV